MRFWEQTGETCMKIYKKIGTCFPKKKYQQYNVWVIILLRCMTVTQYQETNN